jgi:hypothetical protein
MESKKPGPIGKKIKTLIQGDNSTRSKKNASGGKTYKSRGIGTDGTSRRMKLKTRGESGDVTSVNVIKEKGLFGGKKKTLVKGKKVEYLNENGSMMGNFVKKKTITKAPGVFGKRTVKRETMFVEKPKSLADDNKVYDRKTVEKRPSGMLMMRAGKKKPDNQK